MLPQSGTRILFPSGTISTPSLYHFAGASSSSSPPTRSGFSFRPEQSQHHPCTTLREHRPPQPQYRRWRSPAKWYKDGVEIVPDGKRIQIVSEGKKRKLIIKDCKVDDTAGITVKVPGDESSAPLNVKHHNGFKKGMRDFKQCVEREEIVFNV